MYIQVDEDFQEHPKARRLCRILMNPLGWAYCPLLWRWCTKFRKDGDLTTVDPVDLEYNLGWTLEPGKLFDAMVAAGFIDRDGDNVTVHDWHKYQGAAIQRMENDKERLKNERARRRDTTKTKPIASEGPLRLGAVPEEGYEEVTLCEKLPTVVRPSSDRPPTLPRRSPDRLPTVGVSIAEHSRAEHTEPDSSALAGPTAKQVALRLALGDPEPDPEPALLTFPCAGPVAQWHLTASHVHSARLAFPQLDILAECRRALFWVQSNQRKTAKGMPRFLNTWFGNAQNKARGPGGGGPSPPSSPGTKYRAL